MLTIDRLTLQLPTTPAGGDGSGPPVSSRSRCTFSRAKCMLWWVRQAQVKACWPTPLWGYCPKRHGSQESCASRGGLNTSAPAAAEGASVGAHSSIVECS